MSLLHGHGLIRSRSSSESSTPSQQTTDGHTSSLPVERRSSLFSKFHKDKLKQPDVAAHDGPVKHNAVDPSKLTRAATIQLPVLRHHQGHQDHQDRHENREPPRHQEEYHAVAEPRSPANVEPKQPTNVQDVLEGVLESMDKRRRDSDKTNPQASSHRSPAVLNKEDVKYLFSGAPHFMLEKGRHNQSFPQAVFPWDTNVQDIQDLWDRQPLHHESFTLSTLHAHLPVPDGKNQINWKYRDGVKRSTFNVNVYEVPNMLAINGKEPGCVGFRHFLELPLADSVRNKPASPKPEVDHLQLAKLPVSEAFDILQHLRDPYSDCTLPTVLDRHKLVCEGPTTWKRVGIRDVHIKTIVERLEELANFQIDILEKGKTITILDKESSDFLHNSLYTKFLYPPTPKVSGYYNPRNLKSQIEVLTHVLAVKGAWIDFSLVEWRLRVGQVLWEMPPHADGDCIDLQQDALENKRRDTSLLKRGVERKWLLLQLLLAAELLVRLDAVVRVGILQNSSSMIITAEEIHHLENLRHGKVNWDLIFVQRFFDNLSIRYCPPSSGLVHSPSPEGSPVSDSPPKTPTSEANVTRKKSILSRIGSLTHHQQTANVHNTESECAWDCIITPRRLERQLQGLFVFAKEIGWPEHDKLEETMRSKLQACGQAPDLGTASAVLSSPIHNEHPRILDRKETYRKSPSRQLVVLHPAHSNKETSESLIIPSLGGWLSRSWLAGLVLPGEVISHFLMATLLENDTTAIEKLGSVANLFGGFQYNGHSWWSKKCIVARVLSAHEGTTGCEGWARIDVTPCEKVTGETLKNTWFEVDVRSVPSLSPRKDLRIHQGIQLARDSNPLGRGKISSNTFSIPVDRVPSEVEKEVVFRELTLSILGRDKPDAKRSPLVKSITIADQAFVSFDFISSTCPDESSSNEKVTIVFPLTYDVNFISSYTCRPPRGYTGRHPSPFPMQGETSHSPAVEIFSPESSTVLPTHTNEEYYLTKFHDYHHHHNHPHLPGHPLHNSYTYKYIPLTSLRPDTPAPSSSPSSPSSDHEECSQQPSPDQEGERKQDQSRELIWILDARGSRDKETLARAWCASAGTSAVIGRVGRTCLACCIREARAADVGIVVRVGSLT